MEVRFLPPEPADRIEPSTEERSDRGGHADVAAGFAKAAVEVLEHAAANVSGELRSAFLARSDVAELIA